MKGHGCESYNVLVDLPELKLYPVNPDKTSHSKNDWNKLHAVPNRSTFDSTVKMLELNTDINITFVVSDVKINELSEETTDVICLDKNIEVLQNEVHMNEYGVEEKVKVNDVMIDKSSQNKMTDLFLNHYQNKHIKFLSNFIKYASMT